MRGDVLAVLDLSGFGFSGKHACSDLVREFDGFFVPHYAFEFNLLRIQGGLLDLESALVSDWSLVRSSEAIRRFRRVVSRLGTVNRWTKPRSWFTAMGPGYDRHFRGRFVEVSEAYVDRLLTDRWVANWPFPRADLSGPELFLRKLLRKLGLKRAEDFEIYLAAPSDFIGLTREYLLELLSLQAPEGFSTVVLHNAFEPFNPQRSLQFFDSARCIVIDRDARDNFAQHWVTNYRPMQVPVETFIRRFRTYHAQVKRFDNHHPAVLRLNFEDLVLDYDEALSRIFGHLGLRPEDHAAPRAFFDPAVSRKNVGIWRGHPRQDEIRRIEDELGEYCRAT